MNPVQDLLHSEYKNRKDKNPQFSIRSFAAWLSMSPAQLSQMMSGKRPMSLKLFKKVSQRLSLSPLEKESFIKKITAQNANRASLNQDGRLFVKEDEFQLIADWYHFAILSLIKLPDFSADPRWIAKRLGITATQANEAIDRLVRLKIIETKPKLKQITQPLNVVSETPSAAIRKFHKQCLNLAAEKIETVDLNFRELQSMTFQMNPSKVKNLKKSIDEFLESVSESADDAKGTEVYQMNIQLIPLTILKETK